MNNLGLPAVPRSASSSSLYHRSGHSTPVPPTSASRSDTPVAFPRVASSSTSHAGVAGASSYAPSHLPQDHHHHHHLPSRESPRLPYSSVPPQPLTASTSSSNTHPHAHLHHSHGYNSTYDARLVANTINRIEATSGIGAPGSTIEGLGGSGASGSPALGSGGSLGSSNANTSGGGIGGTASTSSTNLAGQAPDADGWTAVCIRTLPLFNGEGQRGYIEDLNDLVSVHIRKTIDKLGPNSQVITSLSNDLVDLLAMGMLTLNAKLTDLSDDKLLIRITEVWNFFFIGCLPYIEGIFLPLRTDPSVQQIVNTSLGRSVLASNSSSAKNRVVDPIDIRRMALRAFRDHLVLPIVDRLAILFASVPTLSASQPVEPSTHPLTSHNISSTARTASSRRLQMVSILVSIQTDDERQAATEALAKALRVGLERRPSLMPLTGSGSNTATHTRSNSFSGHLGSTKGSAGLYGQPASRRSYYGLGMSAETRDAERRGWRRARHILPPRSDPAASQQPHIFDDTLRPNLPGPEQQNSELGGTSQQQGQGGSGLARSPQQEDQRAPPAIPVPI